MSNEANRPEDLAALAPALPSQSACVFTLGEESCAIHVRQISAVVTLGTLTRVPGAPPALVGVTNVRGTVVPVVDLRPLLGLRPASVGAGASAVVLVDSDLRAALAVDRVLGLERFESALPPPDSGRFVSLASGVLPSPDGSGVLPSPDGSGVLPSPDGSGVLPSPDGTVTLLDGPAILATVRRAWAPAEDPVAGGGR